MDTITKLERTVLGWFKSVPHLPKFSQRWIGENIWWIIVIATIITALAALGNIFALLGNLSILQNSIVSYYASASFLVWSNVVTTITLIFNAITAIILGVSVTPLREKQKKGWVLLFLAWLVTVVSSVVAAFLTLNVAGFILSLLFSGLFIVVSGYFLFEIHGEFAHTERSRGVKSKRSTHAK